MNAALCLARELDRPSRRWALHAAGQARADHEDAFGFVAQHGALIIGGRHPLAFIPLK